MFVHYQTADLHLIAAQVSFFLIVVAEKYNGLLNIGFFYTTDSNTFQQQVYIHYSRLFVIELHWKFSEYCFQLHQPEVKSKQTLWKHITTTRKLHQHQYHIIHCFHPPFTLELEEEIKAINTT